MFVEESEKNNLSHSPLTSSQEKIISRTKNDSLANTKHQKQSYGAKHYSNTTKISRRRHIMTNDGKGY